MPKKRFTNTAIARRIGALEQKLDKLAERHAPEQPAGKLHRTALQIENFGLTRILAAGAAWLVLITVGSFWFDYITRGEERAARVEEAEFRKLAQVATAWELLLTRAGGDIGKGNALNTIIAAQGQINEADLSCENAGVFRGGTCIARPQYNNVVLGDEEFWTNDPSREECTGFSCGTRSYVRKTNFTGAIITDLTAEALELDEKFNGVRGQGWRVRRASFNNSYLSMRDGGERLDKSTVIFCVDCWFFQSVLPWFLVSSFKSPVIESSTVLTQNIEAKRMSVLWNFTTFLDTPVIYRSDEMGWVVAQVFNGEIDEKDFDPDAFVNWDIYSKGTYCVNTSDYLLLRPHLTELYRVSELERLSEDRLQARTDYMDGRKETYYPAPIIISRDAPTGENWREFFASDDARTVFRDAQFGVTAGQKNSYDCTFNFEQVEPLLRKRISDRLALKNWN